MSFVSLRTTTRSAGAEPMPVSPRHLHRSPGSRWSAGRRSGARPLRPRPLKPTGPRPPPPPDGAVHRPPGRPLPRHAGQTPLRADADLATCGACHSAMDHPLALATARLFSASVLVLHLPQGRLHAALCPAGAPSPGRCCARGMDRPPGRPPNAVFVSQGSADGHAAPRNCSHPAHQLRRHYLRLDGRVRATGIP